MQPEGSYNTYIDGAGWKEIGSRDDGYCPVCNTKNFDAWQKKMAAQLAEKMAQDDALRAQQAASEAQAAADRARAAAREESADAVQKFTYSNGDIYEGQMSNGVRCGHGTMVVADGSCYVGSWCASRQRSEDLGRRDRLRRGLARWTDARPRGLYHV